MSKIVLLTDDYPPLSFGGAGIVAKNLATELVARGHQVSVITTVRQADWAGESLEAGITVYKIYSSYPEFWRAYLGVHHPVVLVELKKILTKIRPDIVHAHNLHYHLSWAALSLARTFTSAVFLTAHDTQSFAYGKVFPRDGRTDYRLNFFDLWRSAGKRFNPLRNWFIHRHLNQVAKIFCVSYSLEQALKANGIGNTATIHNGINSADWVAPTALIEATKHKYNLNDKKVVLFAGRLSGAKGGERLVEAFEQVAKKEPSARLLVLGQDQGYAETLKNYIASRDLSAKIIFSGWLSGPDLIAAYWTADVVVVPSLYLDPFPTVNLEAMACHKPVLGTCWGGTPEAVVDGQTGLIVDPTVVGNLGSKFLALLADPARLRQMGEAGYNRVSTELSLARQTDAVLDWYQKFQV